MPIYHSYFAPQSHEPRERPHVLRLIPTEGPISAAFKPNKRVSTKSVSSHPSSLSTTSRKRQPCHLWRSIQHRISHDKTQQSSQPLFESANPEAPAASHAYSLVYPGIKKTIAIRYHADSAFWTDGIAGIAAAALRVVFVEYGKFLFQRLFGLLRGRIGYFFKTPYTRDFTRRRSIRSLGVEQYLAMSLSLMENSFTALA